MRTSEFEYVSHNRRKYTEMSACNAVASDFVEEVMVNRNMVSGYNGRYLSYTKKINLCNEDIIIDVSFDMTDICNTFELIILKDNPEIPDNEKERIHWFCSRLLISSYKKNAAIYNKIAQQIMSDFISLFINYSDRSKNLNKVLSEVYKDDKNNTTDNH